MKECPLCNGVGVIPYQKDYINSEGFTDYEWEFEPCYLCETKGRVTDKQEKIFYDDLKKSKEDSLNDEEVIPF